MKKLLEDREEIIFILLEPNNEHDDFMRKKFQSLRYQEFVIKKNRNWEKKNIECLEVDEYDQHSDYIICLEKNEIIAGCRLVNNNEAELPISKTIGKTKSNSIEISRMISISKNPEVKHILYGLIYQHVIKNHYDYVYVMIRLAMIKMLKRGKINIFKKIGNIHHHHGLKLVPMMAHMKDLKKIF